MARFEWMLPCILAMPLIAFGQDIDKRYRVGELIQSDDFHDLHQWSSELEKGGKVVAEDGRLEIDVPAGATVWFKPRLTGPVFIQYDATVVSKGGVNDRVSDLNCFWMATD